MPGKLDQKHTAAGREAGASVASPAIWLWLTRHWKELLALLVVLALSALVFSYQDRVAGLGGYSYLGAFFIAMAGAATIVFPLPNWTLIASLGAALDPSLVGLVCAAGGTIGEMTGYALGYSGKSALEKVPRYQRMVGWMRRRGSLTIFILALLPNPLFDVAAAAAGALRFPVWKYIVFGFAGRLPKSLLYAYLGVWSPTVLHNLWLWGSGLLHR